MLQADNQIFTKKIIFSPDAMTHQFTMFVFPFQALLRNCVSINVRQYEQGSGYEFNGRGKKPTSEHRDSICAVKKCKREMLEARKCVQWLFW